MRTPDLPIVKAAGGLVIDRSNRILFIFKDGKWDLPKGLIERNESAAATAIKETSEETGLSIHSLSSIAPLIPTHHISKYKKNRYLKKTEWFLLFCGKSDQAFAPQKEEGIEHCEWVHVWDLSKIIARCPSRVRYLVDFWLKLRKT